MGLDFDWSVFVPLLLVSKAHWLLALWEGDLDVWGLEPTEAVMESVDG